MLKVLMIDDQADAVEPVRESLEDHFGDECQCWIKTFSEVNVQVQSLQPDVIVLDIWEGPLGMYDEGISVLNQIWEKWFRPVVIYSAQPKEVRNHPFVRTVKKGSDSEDKVIEAIEALRPYMQALQETVQKGEKIIRHEFSEAMKTVAPHAFGQSQNQGEKADYIIRAGHRRIAARMDESWPDTTTLAPWEQYLCPPVSDDLQLGDILQCTVGLPSQSQVPEDFRLVLTPSCDMVGAKTGQSKVKEILVAKCCSLAVGLGKAGLDSNTTENKLGSHPFFSQGFYQSVLPLPRLEGEIPSMAANFRTLELIPVADIAQFERKASLDSPFREMVGWAYLQCAGRPGLPDRDFSMWLPEIRQAKKVPHLDATAPLPSD